MPSTTAQSPGASSQDQHRDQSPAGTRLPYLPFRRMSLQSADSLESTGIADQHTIYHTPQPSPKKFGRISRPPSIAPPLSLYNVSYRPKGSPSQDAERLNRKRWEVVTEFHQTERTYVEGLDIIYSQFLVPLMDSLGATQPILNRNELHLIFSNFIDIWNFHKSFYSSLSSLFQGSTSQTHPRPPDLSSTLQIHFPYLSLYTPFVTSFPAALSTISNLKSNNLAFSSYLKTQEADERCRRLDLAAWLLTIVQRCPRYLLMLKDLIRCISPDDSEHARLVVVHNLISKITLSLNTSIHTYTQTLALVDLQKSTYNLPFPLIAPGRALLKRDTLTMGGRHNQPREFLLFSDCVIWLAPIDNSYPWMSALGVYGPGKPSRPKLGTRTRSRSDAELPRFKSVNADLETVPQGGKSNNEPQWQFKGRLDLIDLEVVCQIDGRGDGGGLDILSPEQSFALFAATPDVRDDWVAAIRGAKASLLMSLNTSLPNTTLTSSASNEHVRRALQALPFSPNDSESSAIKRGKVDQFIPPVWVPDNKMDNCMRCSRAFSWRRRRHHCRLCGRCVCASCSEKTFFISNPEGPKPSNKAARACNVCYETVFPVMSPPNDAADTAMQFTETNCDLPVWRTTKDVHMAASVIDLLRKANGKPSISSRASVGQDLYQISGALEDWSTYLPNDGNASPSLASPISRQYERPRKRFSTPVIALQDTLVTTHSESSGTESKRWSLLNEAPGTSELKKQGRHSHLHSLQQGRALDCLHDVLSRE